MPIVTSIDTLRGRFLRHLHGQSLTALAESVAGPAVHYRTLQAFVRGEHVSISTLLKIEAWCDAQEEATHG